MGCFNNQESTLNILVYFFPGRHEPNGAVFVGIVSFLNFFAGAHRPRTLKVKKKYFPNFRTWGYHQTTPNFDVSPQQVIGCDNLNVLGGLYLNRCTRRLIRRWFCKALQAGSRANQPTNGVSCYASLSL